MSFYTTYFRPNILSYKNVSEHLVNKLNVINAAPECWLTEIWQMCVCVCVHCVVKVSVFCQRKTHTEGGAVINNTHNKHLNVNVNCALIR